MEATEAGALESPRLPPDISTITDQPADLDEFEYPTEDEAHERCLGCFAMGWQARQPEIDALQAELARVNDEADRLWLRAHNSPEEVAVIMRRRLDQHFIEEEARFFGEAL